MHEEHWGFFLLFFFLEFSRRHIIRSNYGMMFYVTILFFVWVLGRRQRDWTHSYHNVFKNSPHLNFSGSDNKQEFV